MNQEMMTKKDIEILRLKEGNEELEDSMKQLRSKATDIAYTTWHAIILCILYRIFYAD